MDYTVLLAEDQKKLRAVVRNIVSLHGGSCRAERIPDGILFRVELP